MPDVFVPRDTIGFTSYLSNVLTKRLTIQYSFQYTDSNREKLSQFDSEESLLNHLRQQGVVEKFIQYADKKGVQRRNILIQKSYKLLEKNLYGNIIYNMLGQEAYIRYANESDPTVKAAIELLEKGETFPKAPLTIEQPKTEKKNERKKKSTAQVDSTGENPILRLYATNSFG